MFHAGQQIGVYVLIERLGKGGFGEVWLAEKTSGVFTKKVAIKLPHEENVNLEAIKQEASLWEQVSKHENVLTIFDADIFDGQVAIISEYAEGGSLADKLKAEGKIPVEQAIELCLGILKGLDHLHSKNIVHRDIKPQNILLQGKTPRLADFGISRAMNTSNMSSVVIGTDSYMAPEALDGKRNVQTDIWSVGVVLYQLLKGSLPFPQEHYSERMFAIVTKEFAPLPEDIPQSLREIVKKALSKKPEDRFQTADEMCKKLETVLTYLRNPTFAPTEIISAPIKPPPDTPATGLNESIVTKTPFSQSSYEVPPTMAAAHATEEADKTTDETKMVENMKFVVPSTPRPASNPLNRLNKGWLIAVAAVSVVSLLVIINLPVKNNRHNNSNRAVSLMNAPSNRNNQPVYSPTPTPTPTPVYDIPEIEANVEELNLFEYGKGYPPKSERKYATTFDKNNTRYINYELNLKYPYHLDRKYFKIERIWYKEGTVMSSSTVESFIEGSWTSSYHDGGHGSETPGSWAEGNYRLEIKYKDKVIASKNFKVENTLAGNWDLQTWGDGSISGGGDSYSGTFTLPRDGTFKLNRVSGGTYRGTWKYNDGTYSGTIDKAALSSDGKAITLTWDYSPPSNVRTSTWKRKTN